MKTNPQAKQAKEANPCVSDDVKEQDASDSRPKNNRIVTLSTSEMLSLHKKNYQKYKSAFDALKDK